jgi:hypothetical protein
MEFVVWILIIIGFGLLKVLIQSIPRMFYWACGVFVAGWVTPSGHQRFGKYVDSEGYRILRNEHYEIEPKWESNAMQKIK